MRTVLALIALICLPAVASAAVQHEAVEYQAGGTALQGHLYYDDAVTGARPGILVVHEWWGLNDYAQHRARQLAEEGYAAFAVDMYGQGRTTEHPSEAGQFAQAVMKDFPTARARFEAALDLLREDPHVDPERMAAIGYCFGGGVVLNMARTGVDLDAVVSFHGSLNALVEAEPGDVKATLLVCHGAADPMASHELVAGFLDEMERLRADYVFMAFGGAKHSFTNPAADQRGMDGLAYDAKADARSWRAMHALFDEVFGR